jgi:putative aldouronate transport system substrate-binding protein
VALWKKFPDIKHDTIAPDGNIYGYPGGVQPYLNYLNQLGVTYRQDWAKKLGLGEPMTVADWYAMLTAFKTKDPNGNGKADEIAYSARYSNCLNVFAGSYGLSAFNEWWSIAKDGKTVLFDWTDQADNAKAYLTEMNKWYKAGLIPAEFGSDLGDKMDALALSNQVGADMHWTLYAPETNAAMAKDFAGTNFVVAYPPKGPTGLVGSEQYGPVNNERWMVTTTAKQRGNEVIAVKFLNFWLATEQGQTLRNWGIEGVSYYIDANGKKQYTNKATRSRYGNISTYLASLGSSRWPNFFPADAQQAQNPTVPQDYWDRMKAITDGNMVKRSFYFGSLVATKTESDTISKYRNDINTYVSEMFMKFILGTEPLSNYDAFVAKLKSLGIDQYKAVKQAQFTRFNS